MLLIRGPHWESKATLCVSLWESEQKLRNSCAPENWGAGRELLRCAECLRGAAGTGGASRAPDSRWRLGSVVIKEMNLENFLLILNIRADDGPRM